jgi:Tfp pilus assembly protein PilZ
MTRSDDPADRRTSERVATRSLIEVKIPDWSAFRSVHAVNMSQGGMRISLGPHARIGIAIDIIISLPNGKRLHLPGEVAHLGGDASGDIGVRFAELPTKVRAEIDGYLQELRAGRVPSAETADTGIPSGALINAGAHANKKKS